MARWTIGLASTPLYHCLDIRTFLSIRASIAFFSGESGTFDRVLKSLLSLGLSIPIRPSSSNLDELNRVQLPTVSAVNAQWRVLAAELKKIPVVSSRCVLFDSPDLSQMESYVMLSKSLDSSFRVIGHQECKNCKGFNCNFLGPAKDISFADRFEETFFRPLTVILETAITRGLGIFTDFFDSALSPVPPSAKAEHISMLWRASSSSQRATPDK
jgi:hypothetical protein